MRPPIVFRYQTDRLDERLADRLRDLNRALAANGDLRRRVASLERENAEFRRQLGAMRQPIIQPVSIDSDPDALTEALRRAERLAYTPDGRAFRPAAKVPETRADRECEPIHHEHAFTIVTGDGKRQICSCGAWRRVLPPEERR